MKRHIICERDVGLFSLIQQVIANIPWAIQADRLPIVLFQAGTCYWTPQGYRNRDTVWEYYFEPLIPAQSASGIPHEIKHRIAWRPPHQDDLGYFTDEENFVTNHFGDHPELTGKALTIPYGLDDPDDALRQQASRIIQQFVRLRRYIQEKADRFRQIHFTSDHVVGVHARGTDSLASPNHPHRHGSLVLDEYVSAIQKLLENHRNAQILVATDATSSLAHLKDAFGDRVIAYESLRHDSGNAVGWGPTGGIMPGYIASDRDRAAKNGEEALIEYLLLTHCSWLVHNGASLARTVLLTVPELAHTNTHQPVQQPALRPVESAGE